MIRRYGSTGRCKTVLTAMLFRYVSSWKLSPLFMADKAHTNYNNLTIIVEFSTLSLVGDFRVSLSVHLTPVSTSFPLCADCDTVPVSSGSISAHVEGLRVSFTDICESD